MVLHGLKQCALEEIHGLSAYLTAEKAMLDFCKLAIGRGPGPGFTCMDTKFIYSFYLFSQAMDTPGSRRGSYHPRQYGEEFAAFIREHKLGRLVETEPEVNYAFHTQHSNKFWIWTPDQPALRKWYEKKYPQVNGKAPTLAKDFYKPEAVDYGTEEDEDVTKVKKSKVRKP